MRPIILLMLLLVACSPTQSNQRPNVEALTLSSARGVAPLQVQWDWRVLDPDGDAVTCRLDADGDGQWEVNSCNPARFSYSYTKAGSYTAKFRVDDGKGGFDERTRTVQVDANQNPLISSLTPNVPAASLVVAFAWQISDPENETLTCELDADNNGTVDAKVDSCTSSSTSSFTYSAAGSYTAKLRVSDGRGGSAERSAAVVVTAPASNVNPAIAQFTATPSSGGAPLNSRFSWQISDANADPLTCRVDTNNDGTFEQTINSCTSSSTYSFIYTAAGSYTARLRVEDGRGGSAERTLTITASNVPNANPSIAQFSATPNSGAAPLSSNLTWSISDPNGDALRCQVDVGNNGSFEYDISPCSSASSQSHSFNATSTVRLLVSDGRGGTASQTLNVNVTTPPSNNNPVIAQFVANPSSGDAPLNSSFSWQISDPDNNPLTCRLDINNDGTAEYTLTNCTSSTTQAHTYTAASSYTARLTVDDGNGGSATRTIVISANIPTNAGGPDIQIGRVEWGQTVLSPNLKLVSGKPALLRVYVLADRAGVAGSLRAQVWRSGVYQGDVSLTGPATLPTTENLGSLAQTFSGTVQASWVDSGLEVRLQADPSNTVVESNESNNSRTLTPNIMTVGNVLYLTSVPVRYTDNMGTVGSSDDVLRTPTVPNFAPFLTDIFPLRQVQSTTRVASYNFTGNLRNGADWQRLLGELNGLRTVDGRGSRHYYYGFVQTGYSSGIIGIGYVGWPAAAGWDRSSSSNYANNSSAWVMAHELGHNFDREHAPCDVSDPDPAYPYANATLGTYGYSFANSVLNLISPSSFRDVMSYCDNQWVSDYTYNAIQRYLESNPPSATRTLAAQTEQAVLLVRGTIRDGAVTLEPFLTLQAVPNLPQSGPYRLRLQTVGGIAEYSFDTHRLANPHQSSAWGARTVEQFSFTVPASGDIRSLEIRRDNLPIYSRDLGVRSMSTDDPGLRLSESGGQVQLFWSPSVFPYAAVAHLGQERTTLALSLTGGEGLLETAQLPAGGQFEVVLSDGLNSRRWVFDR